MKHNKHVARILGRGPTVAGQAYAIINLKEPMIMRIFTFGIVAAAGFVLRVPALSAGVFEDFNNGTYDSNWWTITGEEQSAVSFDSGCCNLTNGAGLRLKIDQWQPPVELRTMMIGNGDVLLKVASNCGGSFRAAPSGNYWSTPESGAGPSTWPPGTNYDFRVLYDGSTLELYVGGLRVLWTSALPLDEIGIEFSSSVYAKLDYIGVNFAPFSPRLTIARSEDNVILMWPTDVTGFSLRSTTDPGLPAPWPPVSKVPVVVNGSNVVAEPMSSLQQFYRLEQ